MDFVTKLVLRHGEAAIFGGAPIEPLARKKFTIPQVNETCCKEYLSAIPTPQPTLYPKREIHNRSSANCINTSRRVVYRNPTRFLYFAVNYVKYLSAETFVDSIVTQTPLFVAKIEVVQQ